jgi:hypothetical protein
LAAVENVFVTISIDTECDHDNNWIRSNPLTFQSIHEGIPNRLQPAFAEVGAVPTYLLTVEVLENPACTSQLKALSGAFELGTHLHAALIEPVKKYSDYAGVDSPDFQCAYPADVEFQKLFNLTQLFSDNFGYKPKSFRAGRYGASAQSIDSLERLGYTVDSSVTPHMKWTEPNATVDFRRAPEQPYFPAQGTIDHAATTPIKGRILEIPVTVKPRFLRGPHWFRPWFATVEQMKEIVNYHLKKYRHRPVVVINMMFHSMEVIEEASPYPQTRDDVARFIDDMQAALQWCADEGAQFAGLSELYTRFAED